MNTLSAIFLTLIFNLVFTVQDKSSIDSIDHLIQNINSTDAVTVYKAIQELKKYTYSEFTEIHKKYLQTELELDTPHIDKLIELCGFLKMNNELLAFAQKEKIPKRVKETLNYALVRAGNKSKLDLLISNLKKKELSDEYAYNLTPILVYTRQKEVFDVLISQIEKKGKLCNHPDLDTPGKFSCAYPIMETLAPYIKDFPVEVNKFGIVSEKPEQLLEDVRRWIKENRTSYELITEIY